MKKQKLIGSIGLEGDCLEKGQSPFFCDLLYISWKSHISGKNIPAYNKKDDRLLWAWCMRIRALNSVDEAAQKRKKEETKKNQKK